VSKPTEKTLFEQSGKCPYCSRQWKLKLVKRTVEPGVKAQTVVEMFIEKDAQNTLEADYQESLKATKKPGRSRKVTHERS